MELKINFNVKKPKIFIFYIRDSIQALGELKIHFDVQYYSKIVKLDSMFDLKFSSFKIRVEDSVVSNLTSLKI